MDGYLLFSHGSLLCGAGQALEQHAKRVRARHPEAAVAVGYLNYSEPTMAQGVDALTAAGASRVVVMPYFLVPGYFVKKSLPEALAPVRAMHPGVEFVIAEALGTHDLLADALIDAARAAAPLTAERAEAVYAVAAAHCRVRPDCPIYGTPSCPTTNGLPRPEASAEGGNTAAAGGDG